MSSINHISGGIVLTGIFVSLWDLNIFSKSWYLVASIFFSLLPDVDHPCSVMGRLLFPISSYLDRHFGHRTITHSLLFLIGVTLATGFFERVLLDGYRYTLIAFFSLGSHMLFDMVTVQGIPLLYPFLRNPCVIPGNPSLRFKSGSFNSESVVFCFLICLGFTCKDLFEQGFWTKYNKSFGTIKHLSKEFFRNSKLIRVRYNLFIFSKQVEGEGFLVGSDKRSVYIYNNAEVLRVPFSSTVYRLNYQKTEDDYKVVTEYFNSISLRSLCGIVCNKAIINLRFNCNVNLKVNRKGFSSGDVVDISYVANPRISKNDEDVVARISALDKQILMARDSLKRFSIRIKRIKGRLSSLGLYEREKQTELLIKLRTQFVRIKNVLLPDFEFKRGLLLKGLDKKISICGHVSYVQI